MAAGWLAGLLAVAAACGRTGLPHRQFTQEYPLAWCDLQVDCGRFPDRESCLASAGRALAEVRVLGALIEDGSVAYDGDAAAACLDALSALSCDRTSFARIDVDSLCAAVARGKLPDGESCTHDVQCAGTGARCWAQEPCDAACCPGTCVDPTPDVDPWVPPKREIGQACTATNSCVEGAFCNMETWVCELLRTEGASCLGGGVCRSDLGCAGGTCRPWVDEGGACGDAGGCGRYDNACMEGVCRRKPLPGEPCLPYYVCIDWAYCAEGACAAKPLAGEPCGPPGFTGLPLCLGDSVCEDSVTCSAVDAAVCEAAGSP